MRRIFLPTVSWLLFVLAIQLPMPALATTALERMNQFFSEQTTYFAEFNQVILDEGLHLIEESSGLVWLSRPDLFRWEYYAPFEQSVVSDGKDLWIYDAELEQASVRNLADILDQSAAEILAGHGDINDDYRVEDLGIQGVLAWISITPLSDESARFESLRLGFDENTLRVMEVLDPLGDTTRVHMLDVVVGNEFQDKVFEFSVPAGVDLIDSRKPDNGASSPP